MTIYEIDEAIRNAYDKAVDLETGEVVDDELFASIDGLLMERDQKIENIACWIKDLEGDAEKIKNEAKALQDRARSAEKKANSLRGYLAYVLNGEKFKAPRCAISFRKSQSVEIDDEAIQNLPDRYLRFKDPEPNKTELKKALQDGEEFEGVRLVEKTTLTIK